MRPPPCSGLPHRGLDELAASLPGAQVVGRPVHVTGMTHDSKAVRPGDLFAALPGESTHGSRFAREAAEAGAVAMMTDAAGTRAAASIGLPVIEVPDAARSVGPIASRLHGDPSHDLDVIGVTGTEGKTTTALLVAAALQACGARTGFIGSLPTRLGDDVLVQDEAQRHRTTPEAPDLQSTLALLRERGAGAVSMEVTSHALALGRVKGTRFTVGVFTNLGHDHLDFHGDIESYFEAKALLFDQSEHAVISVDDSWGRRLAHRLKRSGRAVRTLSTTGVPASWSAVDVVVGPRLSSFRARGPRGRSVLVRLAIAGRFNIANALSALAAADAVGAPLDAIAAGLGSVAGVAGRMEWIDGEITGLVDYAHTPGALTAMLTAARRTTPDGRIVLVFGTGGGRDASKRPLMGAAAAMGADVVVLTDDNPRHEDPASIRADLKAGIFSVPSAERARLLEAPERSRAVEVAVASAHPGDVIVLAGKGPDRIQLVGDRVIPVDDVAALRRAIARRHPEATP